MWLQHLKHFSSAVIDTFVGSIGSTRLGFAVNALFAVLTIAITLFTVYRKHGRQAMLSRWKQDAKTAAIVSGICASILYGPIALYSVGKAVYEDHQGLVAVSKGQRSAIARITDNPAKPNIHLVSKVGKHVTYVYLTDKVQAPAIVVMRCDGPVEKPFAHMAEANFMMARPPQQQPDNNTWVFEIESPVWTPTEPMLIEYDFVTAIAPKCGFEAKDQKP